jgi:diguanylate cyclase (GGDEF)-like protein
MRDAVDRIRRRLLVFPKGAHRGDYRSFVLNTRLFLLTLFGHVSFVPVFIYLGHPIALLNNLLCIAVDVFCVFLNLRGRVRESALTLLAFVCWHSICSIVIFGKDHGFQFYLLVMPIVVFFLRMSLPSKLFISATLFAMLAGANLYVSGHAPLSPQSEAVTQFIFMSNAGTIMFLVFFYADYYHKIVTSIETQLTHEATHDNLTKLPNRAYFFDSLERAILSSSKSDQHLCIVMADVDHFKRVNDTYGHHGGDAVLRRVAQVIRRALRNHDTLARYGGEEFSLILPACGVSDALMVLGRVQQALRAETIDVGDGRSASVTMSFGVTTFHSDSVIAAEQLVQRADEALYRAKQNGRDRIECGDA